MVKQRSNFDVRPTCVRMRNCPKSQGISLFSLCVANEANMTWTMTNSEKREEKKSNAAFKKKYGRKKKRDKNCYNSIRYKVWRKHVLGRDNKTCRYCGSINELHVHHIKEWSKYPRLRYSVSNGMTLCINCHDKTHDGLIDYYRQQAFLRQIVNNKS